MPANTQTETDTDSSQEKEDKGEHIRPDKGSGHYPITDLHFDVVSLVFEKSKALQAYDKYIRDSIPNEELRAVFEEAKRLDEQIVEKLKPFLGCC